MNANPAPIQNEGLNPRQKQAVEHTGGPLLILAGAGSGKTRVIVHRIAHLVRHCGVKPWNILALTFTNKAAAEMRERAASLIGEMAKDVKLCTFHSFCYSVLVRDGDRVGVMPGFTVYDDSDQLNLVKTCMSRMTLPDHPSVSPEKAHAAISYSKNFRSSPQETMNSLNPLAKYIGDIYLAYEKALLENNAVDFDNIILKTLELFEKFPDALQRYRMKYSHLMVDEYQDTNRVQYLLLKELSGGGGDVTVVGDHDQSIYKWRGADISNIVNFEKEFSGASSVALEQNYRSTQKILDAANCLIRNNHGPREKRLWSDLGEGEPVRVCSAYDEREESSFIAAEIGELTSCGDFLHSDIAVLFRTRAQTRVMEETFAKRRVPFQIVGLTGFYQRKETKDIISYLKAIVNPRDTVSLARISNVPRRGIGDKGLQKLFSLMRETGLSSDEIVDAPDVMAQLPPKVSAFLKLMRSFRESAAAMPLSDFLEHLFAESGYASYLLTTDLAEATSRTENVKELLSITVEMGAEGEELDLESFLFRVSLASDQDGLKEGTPTVKLMTLHCAKGLEYPVVFIAGMENGLLPHHNSKHSVEDLEEERRLCYVGATRAMKKLYLVNAQSRLLFGNVQHNEESRFVREMGAENINRIYPSGGRDDSVWGDDDDEAAAPKKETLRESIVKMQAEPRRNEVPLFADGDKVRHSIWGEGRVVSVKDDEVCIAFPGKGIKRLAARYAPVTKL